jgi:hypothetical protein
VTTAGSIRPCQEGDLGEVLAIVNAAAEAYREVIPADRWHEPYMGPEELDAEIAAGVAIRGYQADGRLLGVMGIQAARDVDLIRHAYVKPGSRAAGVGASAERCSPSCVRAALGRCWSARGRRRSGPCASTSVMGFGWSRRR